MATPRHRLHQELDLLAVRHSRTTWARELAAGRQDAVRGLGHALRAYYEYAVAPYWESIRSLVRADHQQQVSHLSGAGVEELLGRLHPSVRWKAPVLEISGFAERELHLDGRGLRLQPSVFCWKTPTKLFDPQLQPVLVYPVQHVPGLLHRTDADNRSQSLAALLGTTRAAALEAIADGCTTTVEIRACSPRAAGGR